MLVALIYLMIVLFLVLVYTKKMSAFAGLIISSTVVGPFARVVSGVPLTDLFSWFKDGPFYTLSDSGSAKLGTINSGVMILFVALYLSLMMNVGLLDPLCTFLVRKAKGDPLRVMMATTLIFRAVTLDGDGTTTTLIVITALIPLSKKMNMKLSNLVMMITLPYSIGNCLPWGGPLVRAAFVTNVDVNVPSEAFLPVLGVGLVYVIVLAYFLGTVERKRLGYVKGGGEITSAAQIEEMCAAITENDKESKHPKLFVFNLVSTLAPMVMMIVGLASEALLFMVDTGIVITVNHGLKEQRGRIATNGADAVSVAIIIMAVGRLTDVLDSSGIVTVLAANLAGPILESPGIHIPIIFALIGAITCWALPVDAYYFEILPAIAPITTQFGTGTMEITMVSMTGQATRYGNPTVAWLLPLTDRTEMDFGDYLKTFTKYAIPIYLVFIVTALALGPFHL